MNEKRQALKSLQNQMLSWLQQGDPSIRQAVSGTEKVPVDIRLDIYAHAYRYRLIEALQDTFPTLHTLMGDEDFFELGNDYLNHYPSQHFSLRYFGHKLHEFLRQEAAYKKQIVLAETAHFEWLLRAAFDAEDSKALSLSTLQQINPESWPRLKFVFHPSVQRIDLHCNIPQLWQAVEQQQAPVNVVENDYPFAWFVWRKDLKTYYRSMDVDEAWAMDAMISGNDFSEICSGVCEWIDEQHAATRVAGFIQDWLNEEILCEVIK